MRSAVASWTLDEGCLRLSCISFLPSLPTTTIPLLGGCQTASKRGGPLPSPVPVPPCHASQPVFSFSTLIAASASFDLFLAFWCLFSNLYPASCVDGFGKERKDLLPANAWMLISALFNQQAPIRGRLEDSSTRLFLLIFTPPSLLFMRLHLAALSSLPARKKSVVCQPAITCTACDM